MKRFMVFIALLPLAILIAGAYGVVHDQITYSISSEYYTKFKFQQFGLLTSDLPERFRAGIVGFLASWWMGIPIGLLVGLAGFVHADPRRMFTVSIQAFALVVVLTLLTGFGGLGYGVAQTSTIHLSDYRGWFIPDGLVDLRRFLCVGYMHNASYIGGAISMFVACGYQIFARLRHRVA